MKQTLLHLKRRLKKKRTTLAAKVTNSANANVNVSQVVWESEKEIMFNV